MIFKLFLSGRVVLPVALLVSSFGPAFALDMGEARHLLQRTGFGASPGEMVAVAPLTREEAVDRLLIGLDLPDLPVPRRLWRYLDRITGPRAGKIRIWCCSGWPSATRCRWPGSGI